MFNECFVDFKDRHKGDTAIVYGTGPTLSQYDERFSGIRIGCNEMVNYSVPMDYYFIGDQGDKKRGYKKEPDVYDNYKPLIAKFYRLKHADVCGMPEGKNAIYYNVDSRLLRKGSFQSNITRSMGYGASISAEMLQFAIWAGIERIILVGHDCDYNKGTFNTAGTINSEAKIIGNMWGRFEAWVKENHPIVQVFIHNPVSMTRFPTI